jgi:hypothetical protein
MRGSHRKAPENRVYVRNPSRFLQERGVGRREEEILRLPVYCVRKDLPEGPGAFCQFTSGRTCIVVTTHIGALRVARSLHTRRQ